MSYFGATGTPVFSFLVTYFLCFKGRVGSASFARLQSQLVLHLLIKVCSVLVHDAKVRATSVEIGVTVSKMKTSYQPLASNDSNMRIASSFA